MNDLFHQCGPSLENLILEGEWGTRNYNHILDLVLEHCGNLQELTITWFGDNFDFLQIVSRSCPNISRLTIKKCIGFRGDLNKDLFFSALRIFESTKSPLSDNFLTALATGSPLLQKVILGNSRITPIGLKALADNCPLLHTVSLSGRVANVTNLLSVVLLCSNLRTFEVNYDDGDLLDSLRVVRIIRNSHKCDYCRELQTSASGNFTLLASIDTALHLIAKHCPLLTHLSFQCHHTYSGKGLAEVAQSCNRLQRVQIVTGYPLLSLNPRKMFEQQVEVVEELNDRLCCKNSVNIEN
eukprot:gene14945-17140_t